MSTPIAGAKTKASTIADQTVGHLAAIPNFGAVFASAMVFIVCLVLVAFGFTYLQNTWLGLALSVAGILVAYECLYLVLKLTKSRSTDY
jgi:hypothetical protein